MPIYEYQCANCHHDFELIQKMSDDPIKQCPQCGMQTAVRLVSAAGFQLKGTGWYETDFKHKGKPKESVPAESVAPVASSDKLTTESASSSSSKGDDK